MVFRGGAGGKGTLAGTPTKLGQTSFEIGAASAAGISVRKMSVLTRPSPGKPITSYKAIKGEAFRLTLPNPTVTAPSTGRISCTGHFPAGVTFASGRDGLSGTLSGDPQRVGLFSIACSARNHSTGAAKRWALVLVVSTSRAPPTCLSLSLDEVAGAPLALTVEVGGTPTPSAVQSGAWPPGVSLVDNGNGTDSISAVVTLPGVYRLHLAESNAAGRCSDVFRLIVVPARPTFESPGSATVPVHKRFEFPVVASGIPTPKISFGSGCKGPDCPQRPNFPSLLQIKSSDGVAVMVGSPEKPGTTRFSLKAANGAGSATQTFTLTVVTSPTTTSTTTTTTTSSTTTSTTTTSSTTTSPTTTSPTTTSTTATLTTTTLTTTTRCPAFPDLAAALQTSGAPAYVLALCANADGELSAFLIGKNGELYRYDQAASGAWGTPQSMGGTWPDVAPVVVANQSRRLSAFLIGKNGALYRYDQAASGAWGTPQSMGGTWPEVGLTVVANQTGRLSAFLIGKNGALYRYDQAASGAWGTPQSMGGTWSTEPAVVANPSGRLSAFMINSDNGELYRYDQAASGAWGTAQSMGGGVASSSLWPPVVVANPSGRLSVFMINSDNGELYRYDQAASGAWGPPQSMGGTWPDEQAPVVVANPSGQLSAFLIGGDGALYRYDQAASGIWGAPQSMGGTVYDPVVVANPSGQLSAFLIGADNGELYRYDQAASGAWGPPQSMGGTAYDWSPVVVANPSGQLSAFLIGADNGPLYRYDQAASGAWGPPQSMGGTWP